MSKISDFKNILEKAVEVVIPDRLISQTLSVIPGGIRIAGNVYRYSGKLNVFGFGKAATGLVKQTIKILGDRVDNLVCCTPEPTKQEIKNFPSLFDDSDIVPEDKSKPILHIYHGLRNNEPNDMVIKSSLKMAQIASEMKEGDLLLVCITGGGSAMLALPSPLDINQNSLSDKAERMPLNAIIETSNLLSLDGASIQEINSVRSCLDVMKAGGLARFACPAQVISLILSDVIGDPLEFIASGPTYTKDDDTAATASPIIRALDILERRQLLLKVPKEVKTFLESRKKNNIGLVQVNPKPINLIIGNISMSLQSAAIQAAQIVPTDKKIQENVLSKAIFLRTPVDCFQSVLPIILTDTMAGDMGEKADAIADLAYALRGLIQFFLRNPKFHTRHTDAAMRDRIKKAQMRVTDKKENYRDLLHGCYQVAKMVLQKPMGSKRPRRGDFLGGLCLLMGGEATVKVGPSKRTEHVHGGRCSHAALTASLRWYELESANAYSRTATDLTPYNVDIGFFARASDGLDGPSAFGAGAWTSLRMINNPERAELATKCLQCGDSYGFFRRLQLTDAEGHFLPARLTGTNVMDLFACMINVCV